jgi:hypothetical protein
LDLWQGQEAQLPAILNISADATPAARFFGTSACMFHTMKFSSACKWRKKLGLGALQTHIVVTLHFKNVIRHARPSFKNE